MKATSLVAELLGLVVFGCAACLHIILRNCRITRGKRKVKLHQQYILDKDRFFSRWRRQDKLRGANSAAGHALSDGIYWELATLCGASSE